MHTATTARDRKARAIVLQVVICERDGEVADVCEAVKAGSGCLGVVRCLLIACVRECVAHPSTVTKKSALGYSPSEIATGADPGQAPATIS